MYMQVYSGAVCKCDVGTSTGFNDFTGKELFTGDIVMIANVLYPGTDIEFWNWDHSLTVVVSDQHYWGDQGEPEEVRCKPYVMGIKDCGFDSDNWKIMKVKHFADVVEGEHWKDYGFNYRKGV